MSAQFSMDKSGGFSVRALTRDVNSDKAKALADMELLKLLLLIWIMQKA
ncbi:MAG: hypothetical protein MZV64_56130 [Ignavibacteriales bacterium]|nr:hypothetical protein [Ignavibacteriales bacterium]